MSPSLKPAAPRKTLRPAAAKKKNGSGDSFGDAGDLGIIAKVKKSDEGVQLQSPYHRCSLYGVALAASEVFDPDFCIHGPQGCISTIKEGFAIQGKEVEYHTSGMSKDDIVFGGEDTLFESVADIYAPYEKAGPKFVITSCSSEIIGDNVNAVLSKFNPGLPSVRVAGGGVNGNQYRGINNTLYELVAKFTDPLLEKVSNRVNLIGNIGLSREWRGDYYELVRLLEKLGLEVNRVGCDSTLKEYRMAGSSVLTILVNSEIGEDAAKYLRDQYSVPVYTSQAYLPLGLKGAEIWLRDIGQAIGIDDKKLEKLIDQEEQAVRCTLKVGLNQTTYIENLISVKRLPVAVVAEGPVAFSWARFVEEELEMKPVFIGLRTGFDDKELLSAFQEWKKDLVYEPVLAEVVNHSVVEQGIKETGAKYVFGSSVEIDLAKSLGMTGYMHITHPNMHYVTVIDRPFLGYKGVVNAAESIINSMR